MSAGDTGTISQGIGAFASRQAINAGSSAMIAGDNVRKQVVAAASRALGVPESDIDVEDGKAIARTGNKPSLSFGELARMAQGMPGFSFAPGQMPGLEHTAYFTPPQAAYCNGTHVLRLESDERPDRYQRLYRPDARRGHIHAPGRWIDGAGVLVQPQRLRSLNRESCYSRPRATK